MGIAGIDSRQLEASPRRDHGRWRDAQRDSGKGPPFCSTSLIPLLVFRQGLPSYSNFDWQVFPHAVLHGPVRFATYERSNTSWVIRSSKAPPGRKLQSSFV